MDSKEFKVKQDYLDQLKEESLNQLEDRFSRTKSKAFYSLMSTFVQNQKTPLLYRDFLDIDGTFAILLPQNLNLELKEAVGLYLDLCDILKDTTYMKIKNTGFINLPQGNGFWILVG